MLWHYVHQPAVLWLYSVGLACGVAVGTWVGGRTGSLLGSVIGAIFGMRLACSLTIKLHWYEFCYWLHRAAAYVTVLTALIARFDVFWPCTITWALFAADKWVQRLMTQLMYIDTRDSRCIEDRKKNPSKLRLVLYVRSDTYERRSASKWVYLSVPNMFSDATNSVTRAVGSAWHPLSLAAHSDAKIELLIDVHPKLNGNPSWSELLYRHVARLQAGALQVTTSDAHFPPQLEVLVRGPFGSAFSRCFDVKRSKGQMHQPLYDIVVLFGSGIGLPSALSALHEFVQRRRSGKPVPRFVWFMWQCRTTEELQLCWDSLHRIIYGAKGLCDERTCINERQALTRGGRVPLDYFKHQNRNGGQAWDETSTMLEWLGVSLHISSWKSHKGPAAGHHMAVAPSTTSVTSASTSMSVSAAMSHTPSMSAAEAEARAALARDTPLEANDTAADRVHTWLCGRLRAGYHDLSTLLCELDALDHEYSPHQVEPRRLCVSLCGSQRAMVQTRAHMAKAHSKLRGRTEVVYELAADYHG